MKRLSPSRVFGWVVFGLLGAALVQSCGSSSVKEENGASGGSGGGLRPDSSDDVIITPPGDGGEGGASPYNPLCGVVSCVPDDVDACAPTTAGTSGKPGGGTGGSSAGTIGDGGHGAGTGGAAGGGGSPTGDGGVAGEGGQGASGNAGGGAGEAGTSGTGATSGRDGGSGSIVNSCQVRPKNNEPRAQCVPAGPGGADAPCLRGDDCAPGLACVREGDAGQCRPYCCKSDSCPDRTHCFERSLYGVTPPLDVPVCVPSVDCGLAEPFPCPDNATCSCPEGLACMVVGVDRATTCVEPGAGREGQSCPCDWGHVCSQVTNRCVKLCQTAAPEASCETGMCQVSAELPPGWGVCIGSPRPGG
jgi:hypothetical protein